MKDYSYKYQLISRLEQDCKYYLGNGNRNKKYLWAGDEKAQIEKMKELYKNFPILKKPKWLSMRKIRKYARLMGVENSWITKLKRKGEIKK